MKRRSLFGLFCLMCTLSVMAEPPLTFTSPVERVPMLELYTSHGCSSCPPADAWLRQFASRAGLWSEFVPLAFHVDYWDGLGWPDRFASALYSKRQRAYRQSGRIGSVYTPGFIVAGAEWRGWFRGGSPDLALGPAAGRLVVRVDPGAGVMLRFSPALAPGNRFTAQVALLGFELSSRVGGGENAGRTLKEDFVVLGMTRGEAQGGDADPVWNLAWPNAAGIRAPRHALAAWISAEDDPAPVQAVGGWLPGFKPGRSSDTNGGE